MRLSTVWRSAVSAAAVFTLGLLLGVGTFSGCSGSSYDSPEDASSDKQQQQQTDDTAQPKNHRPQNTSPRRNKSPGNTSRRQTASRYPRGVWTDKQGQKWWHKHPYDVWHEDAYSVARDTRPVGSGTNGKSGIAVAKEDDPPDEKPDKKQPASAPDDWKTIAPMAALEAEVKRIRNFFLQKTNSPSVYNGNYKEIAYSGATLAAIAHIIAQHPEDISWKEDALYVRSLGLKISETAVGLGVQKFKDTKLPVEQFIAILNRNKPAGLDEPNKDASFFDIASRGGLMKRMEAAYNWMDKNVPAKAAMENEAEKVKHEAVILGVLMKVIGDDSYFSADDPEYQKHVDTSVQAAQDIRSAVESGDFMTFRKSLSTINNRCTQCHTDFRG